VTGSRRFDALIGAGVDFVAGVPCSYLAAFFAACDTLPPTALLRATREDHAVAACAGAWLGGRTPLTAMQNSGLGYCLEALSSLHLLYRIPLPMLVSDRGSSADFEEHRFLGQRARGLLDLFGIPWREGSVGGEEDDAGWLLSAAAERRSPAVLLVGPEGGS
jgi:sulfopyruvate decarboxylase alpha subunit